jgi:hypothetical protein
LGLFLLELNLKLFFLTFLGFYLVLRVNVLNLHKIDLARKYYTHLQREIEKEEAR